MIKKILLITAILLSLVSCTDKTFITNSPECEEHQTHKINVSIVGCAETAEYDGVETKFISKVYCLDSTNIKNELIINHDGVDCFVKYNSGFKTKFFICDSLYLSKHGLSNYFIISVKPNNLKYCLDNFNYHFDPETWIYK